jgi:hypothetical protein
MNQKYRQANWSVWPRNMLLILHALRLSFILSIGLAVCAKWNVCVYNPMKQNVNQINSNQFLSKPDYSLSVWV